MRIKWICVVVFLILPFGWASSHAADEVSYKSYLTNQVTNNQPILTGNTEFDCSDQIFLVVEVAGLPRVQHNLKVKWMNPLNKQQELTDYDFEALPFTRVWAWIQLHGPTGAVIGQVFDPSSGMEDFIGTWHAKVSINKDKIADLEFHVLC